MLKVGSSFQGLGYMLVTDVLLKTPLVGHDEVLVSLSLVTLVHGAGGMLGQCYVTLHTGPPPGYQPAAVTYHYGSLSARADFSRPETCSRDIGLLSDNVKSRGF